MKVLILTGGPGKKLEPLTETRPKPMIEICGEPLLKRLMRFLQEIGLNQADVVLGHQGDKVRRYFEGIESHKASTRYIEQKNPSGIGQAILHARERISPSDFFMLIYGDILFSKNMLASLLNSFRSLRKPVASVCLTRDSRDFGNIYMNEEMRITEIIEKPERHDMGNYVLAGAFILPGTIIQHLESCNGNLIEAFRFLSDSEGIFASIWEGCWVDLGYPWDILSANQIVMNEWYESRIAADLVLEPGAQIRGPVVIEPGVVVKAGANIIGPCFIGANSFIGHSALVRNYTSIGADSIVGFGVEMKNAVLFNQTETGRLSFIGDSIIGENVNIGSGTVMVNINLDQSPVEVDICGESINSGLIKLGSFVGDNTWIGAGHTLLPGTKISSGRSIPHYGTFPNNIEGNK